MNSFECARAWGDRVYAEGWIDDADRQSIAEVECSGAADLFDDGTRPLVVAFFGGTGVGKSSLLNRVAGEQVTPVGVQRPTSRELVVYAHVSAPLRDLPADLPADRLLVRRHDDERWREVVWVDAPDIDSVSIENREAVLAWLPHVDLLVYVVSPERYRDDVGWRILAQRSQRHGWIFVMNRWDEGDSSQEEDLRRLLAEAGFADALVFHTSCSMPEVPDRLPSPDQLDDLEHAVEALLDENAVYELDRLGHIGRLQLLTVAVEAALGRLGRSRQWQLIRDAWQARWQQCERELQEGLEWPIRAVADGFAVSGPAANPLRPEAGDDPGGVGLWDEWADQRVAACLDELELVARRSGVAGDPLRAGMESAAEQAGALVEQRSEDVLRRALARPGGSCRRALQKVVGFLTAALPAAAIVWIGYTVVIRYYRAGIGEASYLHTDFAVHSALLLLVAWGIPYGANRLLRPAMEVVVARALRRGTAEAIGELGVRLCAGQERVAERADQLRRKANSILDAVKQQLGDTVSAKSGGVLSRALSTSARPREP